MADSRRTGVSRALVAAAVIGACAGAYPAAAAASVPALGDSGAYTFTGAKAPYDDIRVNVASGNLLLVKHDVGASVAASNIVVDRFFNSMGPDASSAFQGIGPNWKFNFGPQTQVTSTSDIETVRLHGPSGYSLLCSRNGSASYDCAGGLESVFTKTSGGWRLDEQSDGNSYIFDADGDLTSVVDSDDREFPVVFGDPLAGGSVPQAKPLSYGSSTSAHLQFQYSGIVTCCSLPNGSLTDKNTQYVDPAGVPRGFVSSHFSNPAAGYSVRAYVNGVVTERFQYGADGRIDSLHRPDGSEATFETDADGRVTRIWHRNPAGAVVETVYFGYSVPGETSVRRVTPSGAQSFKSYAYDDDGRVTSIEDNPSTLPDEDLTGDPTLTDPVPAYVGDPASPWQNADDGDMVDEDGVEAETSLVPSTGNDLLPDAAPNASPVPGTYRIKTKTPGGWVSVRNRPGAFMLGNAKTGSIFDVKRRSSKRAFMGRLERGSQQHYRGCGWVTTEYTNNESSSTQGSCGSSSLEPNQFAKLVNCEVCNSATAIRLVRDANFYRNVRPFAKTPSPHDRIGRLVADVPGKTEKLSIGWRYLSKDGRWLAVRSEEVDEANSQGWGFISIDDVDKSLLCRKNVNPDKDAPRIWQIFDQKPTRTDTRKHWPKVCFSPAEAPPKRN